LAPFLEINATRETCYYGFNQVNTSFKVFGSSERTFAGLLSIRPQLAAAAPADRVSNLNLFLVAPIAGERRVERASGPFQRQQCAR
jgi:hypothetical protein